jgi:DNA phosphorothioation system restriction enzyme
MATGSGKTIIALVIASELYEQINLQVLLVICPFRHLVVQWAEIANEFNLQPILAFESVYNWQSQLSLELYNLASKQQKFLTIVTTNSTFISQSFQSQLPYFPEKTLIVGDEAHNLGSPRLFTSLPATIGLRLALSATPERYFDDDGTDFLINYFGEILQPEFTLADAIKEKALVPYDYYPILVELTAMEALKYVKLTQKIGWALAENENWQNNKQLTSLLIKRSRLIGTAENKLWALRKLMSPRLQTKATLFYCGDGHIGKNERQLEAVTRILGKELNFRVNTYTAETPLSEREIIKQQLQSGELQGLVAIRCLDEGIDMPMLENAVILASGSNPRQFIQRRGRILRPYQGKESATLFDMIVIPPDLERETWEIERNLLKKELNRFIEFANLAKNALQAREILLKLQQKFNL